MGAVLLVLVLLPAVAAAAAYVTPPRARDRALIGTALVHLALAVSLWISPGAHTLGGWLADDALGRVILTLVSVLFLATAQYAVSGRTERRLAFVSCLLAFLAAATLVTLSHHFALLWIGMESMTLSIAPLIYERHDRRSLEAVWKYLVLSSVAIAFALLGVFVLATAQPSGAAGGRALVLEDLVAHGAALDPVWLRAAFVFMLIGFGTKMGLAPLHSWKPDTYGEAPALVGGLMAGALTSCAFIGLARITTVVMAAGQGDFARPALIAFGLLSLLIAAAFIIGQRDVKRLLAYSSVENVGLMALGLGLGGVGSYGAVLHAVNNGVTKAMVFLAVGNIVVITGTSVASRARNIIGRAPISAALLLVGLFAITGSPPFGIFLSEFTIIQAAVGQRHPWIAALTVALLALIFVGIAALLLDIVYAPADSEQKDGALVEARGQLIAPIGLATLALMLGLYLPAPLVDALSRAASALGGRAP